MKARVAVLKSDKIEIKTFNKLLRMRQFIIKIVSIQHKDIKIININAPSKGT